MELQFLRCNYETKQDFMISAEGYFVSGAGFGGATLVYADDS